MISSTLSALLAAGGSITLFSSPHFNLLPTLAISSTNTIFQNLIVASLLASSETCTFAIAPLFSSDKIIFTTIVALTFLLK